MNGREVWNKKEKTPKHRRYFWVFSWNVEISFFYCGDMNTWLFWSVMILKVDNHGLSLANLSFKQIRETRAGFCSLSRLRLIFPSASSSCKTLVHEIFSFLHPSTLSETKQKKYIKCCGQVKFVCIHFEDSMEELIYSFWKV